MRKSVLLTLGFIALLKLTPLTGHAVWFHDVQHINIDYWGSPYWAMIVYYEPSNNYTQIRRTTPGFISWDSRFEIEYLFFTTDASQVSYLYNARKGRYVAAWPIRCVTLH